MPVNQSRFVAFWASHERRAQVYGRLLTVCLALLGLSLANTYRAWSQPREVVRIGCDGIPQLVRINEEVYQEPDEREIRAFASMFAVMYARGDSFSVVNDYVFAASKMTAELREPFRLQARGTAERPGVIQVVESLRRRTQVDPGTLEFRIEKKVYPWRVTVKGVRQIVGAGPEADEKFELDLELVRASRNQVIEGLLVYAIHAKGDPVEAAMLKRPSQEAGQ
jgi:hypothetical protein